MLAKVHSLALIGMECEGVEVEIDVANGNPQFNVVGLGDAAVQESRERVRAAVKNTGHRFPGTRITANLAPANIRKIGVIYDLPIAFGVILATHQCDLSLDISKTLFVGELALDGKLRPINGVLSMVLFAKSGGFDRIVLPRINAPEASLIDGVEIIAAESLTEVLAHFSGERSLDPVKTFDFNSFQSEETFPFDFSQIKGQHLAKRALEIAAAGGHNILMNGSPGSGKTLMAQSFPSILPKLTLDEALEVTKIYSIANELPHGKPLITKRPFRSVHHTSSGISIIGGGRIPSPGEISLAHKGVLFLDELPEFPTNVLEVLRQPLEDKKITVTRANGSSEFPADFTLLAAMNPCPCGYYGVPHATKPCTCAIGSVQRYQKKISGPLLDRIDLYVDVSPVSFEKLHNTADEENSKSIRERVQKARDRQIQRFAGTHLSSNTQMGNKEIKKYCPIPTEAGQLLELAVKQMHLSARAYNRILKVSRTIADLEDCDEIQFDHVAEALQYRKKEEI